MKFRKLNPSEIDCRVSTIKANGLSLLLYKNARVDMAILDEVVGAEYWQRDHKEVKGNVYCGVSIRCEVEEAEYEMKTIQEPTETLHKVVEKVLVKPGIYEWITKWDAGAESYTEKVKGEASDSFKRACFNWGIGRELYTAPFIWITPKDDKEFICTNPTETNIKKRKFKTYAKFNVFDIEYKEDVISYLAITDDTGKIRYTNGKPVPMTQAQLDEIWDFKLDNDKMDRWTKFFKINDLKKLSKKQAETMIDILGKK